MSERNKEDKIANEFGIAKIKRFTKIWDKKYTITGIRAKV